MTETFFVREIARISQSSISLNVTQHEHDIYKTHRKNNVSMQQKNKCKRQVVIFIPTIKIDRRKILFLFCSSII